MSVKSGLTNNKMLASIFESRDFENVKTVIAAVSGGGDSIALMFLLKHQLATMANPPKLIAITVDHQLRPESGREAHWVGEICQKNAIEHRVISWRDAKPITALSYNARIARYELLFHQAEQYDAPVMMTGHTLEDQAETYHMRAKRNSIRGLAAMARESLLMAKLKLIRPLLKIRRPDLRTYLHAIGQDWVEDPSNHDTSYERVRIRQSLTEDEIVAARTQVDIAAAKRQQQSQDAAQLLASIRPSLALNTLSFAPLTPEQLENPQLGFLLGIFAAIQGGTLYLPSDPQTQYLKTFATHPADSLRRITTSGSVIEKNTTGWRIWRENRNLQPLDIAPQRSAIWDGRFQIDNQSAGILHIAPASLTELKNIMASHHLAKKNYHFLSLQSAFVIRSHTGIDIPILTQTVEKNIGVTVAPFMRPFGWLVSGHDFVLYDALKPIFASYCWKSQKNTEKSL